MSTERFPVCMYACTVCTYIKCVLSITDCGVSEMFGCQFKRSFLTLAISGLYRIFDFLLQLLLTGLSTAVKRCERRWSGALISSRSPQLFGSPKWTPLKLPRLHFCALSSLSFTWFYCLSLWKST